LRARMYQPRTPATKTAARPSQMSRHWEMGACQMRAIFRAAGGVCCSVGLVASDIDVFPPGKFFILGATSQDVLGGAEEGRRVDAQARCLLGATPQNVLGGAEEGRRVDAYGCTDRARLHTGLII